VAPWGWWAGYIHPDEFFQSPEVAAGAVLNHTTGLWTPWEFLPSYACRTISLPYVL
jgi:phosphatidylinositol glycan class Z